MTTTTITLTVATVEEKAVPHRTISWATCSPSTNASPKSTATPALRADTQVFACVFKSQRYGFVKPDGVCRAPGTPFPNGGQLQARGLLNFNIDTGTVAITGGTDDYLRASGHMKFNENDYTLTIETP